MKGPTVSLVATVLNEYRTLPDWIDGLTSQTVYPRECIIVDGGSTDGTVDYLRSAELPFPAKIVSRPGCTISEGRNIGIGLAQGDVIAITDAGTRASPTWIELLVAPFAESSTVDFVAGSFSPRSQGEWATALAAATLPDPGEIDVETFLPSSRSAAVRRSWFEHGFTYPEWLDYCEDLVFDLQLIQAGARMAVERRASVDFFPRESPRAFALQYFRYARGDGIAGLFLRRHLIRYGAYLGGTIILARRRPAEILVLLVAGLFHMRKPLRRLRKRNQMAGRNPGRAVSIVALVALQMVLGDLAKMAGYPVGLCIRARADRSAKFWKTGWKSRTPRGTVRHDGSPTRGTQPR